MATRVEVQMSSHQRAVLSVKCRRPPEGQLVLLSLQEIQDVLVSHGSAALVLGSVPALLSSAASRPTHR